MDICLFHYFSSKFAKLRACRRSSRLLLQTFDIFGSELSVDVPALFAGDVFGEFRQFIFCIPMAHSCRIHYNGPSVDTLSQTVYFPIQLFDFDNVIVLSAHKFRWSLFQHHTSVSICSKVFSIFLLDINHTKFTVNRQKDQ